MSCLYCGVTSAGTATHCDFCGQWLPVGRLEIRKPLLKVAITVVVPLILYALARWLLW